MKNPTILAELHKTPKAQIGSYSLQGYLPDGRLIEVVANQKKSREADPDFLVLVLVLDEDGEKGRPTHG